MTILKSQRNKSISGVSDLPLAQWREYDDIFTDSLWIMGNRDKSGEHSGSYHGNFVPQIPRQLMRRYTAAGDIVLDPFLGSGTTMIEARRMGRNCIGVELLPDVAKNAQQTAQRQKNEFANLSGTTNDKQTFAKVITGDSSDKAVREKVTTILQKYNRDTLDLIVLHPPYHDIIKFSDDKNDLSNAKSIDEFVNCFGNVIENFSPLLKPNHYLAVIIGDKYANSEWIPLGFQLMQETLRRNDKLILKSTVVKNMVNNRAKRNQENLWRYRALSGGFYVFRHEYIFLFKKKP